MNSYPHEFLAHPQPLMFIAGLLPRESTAPTRDRASSSASSSALSPGYLGAPSPSPLGSGVNGRRPSDFGASALLDPTLGQGYGQLTTPLTSPTLGQSHGIRDLSTSPPATVTDKQLGGEQASPVDPVDIAADTVSPQDKEFDKLVQDLRGALEVKSTKGKVWLGPKERKEFKMLLVDKAVRLPARKVNAAAASGSTVSNSSHTSLDPPTPHSPLSPLTPTSPLYPDGLIAPVWVRKHAELIPSVFVLFLRLWESDPASGLGSGSPKSPSNETDAEGSEALRAKEREMDDLLVKEIGERRRRLGERGIKLTVVLMASAAALDSPVLDPRLSYLRRSSALSAKASLFVLTPVPADQLPDFVQSLQDALHDSALEYYSAHGKKVRRKRSRVPASQIGLPQGVAGRGLGPQGWAVRYDWKAGWFAEMRGELDVARRHYEDCWNELAKMFSSTTTFPPRSKRWAEAKVLADCVAVRICKLLLYEGEGSKVLGPFFVHLKRFGDLSRGWGIGEETFEFWSWIARQYRIFAELLELGIIDGLQIPISTIPIYPVPGSGSGSVAIPPPGPAHEFYATPQSSSNPSQVLQTPAYYFYTAAECTAQRKKRFADALAVEEDAMGSEAGSASGYVSTAPGFANEKKVDHGGLIVELFTKAYTLLKEQEQPQSRVALYVAFRIAETYCQSGQHELAMRFFDRISPTFQRDRWTPVVRQIRGLWYESAQRTGFVEVAARILLEMISPESGIEDGDRAGLQEDFLSLIKTTSPSSAEPIIIETGTDEGILNVKAGFWTSESELSAKVPFQVTLACPETVDISQLTFSTLSISFSGDRSDLVIIPGGVSTASGDYIDVGSLEEVNETRIEGGKLQWQPGRNLTIAGLVSSDREDAVQITTIRLSFNQGAWNIELILTPSQLNSWTTTKGSQLSRYELSSSLTFKPLPHALSLTVDHEALAYVGEAFPLAIKVLSEDERPMDLYLSLFLQPGEDEDDSTISFQGEESRSLIQNVSLGTLNPDSALEKSIYLKSPRAGTKVIDFSLRSTLAGTSLGADANADADPNAQETTKTVEIPVQNPFTVSSSVTYRYAPQVTDGETIEGWAIVESIVACPGGRAITVESIELDAREGSSKVLWTSLSSGPSGRPEQIWDGTTHFAVATKFALYAPRRSSALETATHSPADVVIAWRPSPSNTTPASGSKDPSAGVTTTARLPLPPLALPPQDSFITASIHPPKIVNPHEPFPLVLSIFNAHPTLTASALSVQVEPAEGFVWIGPRLGRIMPIGHGETREVVLEMMASAGGVSGVLPRVRVWDGIGDEREELDVTIHGGAEARVFVRP